MKNNKKIGRNDPCPCGSGLKYKKCCGNPNKNNNYNRNIPDFIKQQFREKEAKEKQRREQQGLGRPIISIDINGYKMVAVKNILYNSKEWKTFHDFLFSYIKKILGEDWVNKELKKPIQEQHPILIWRHVCDDQRKFIEKQGEVSFAPMNGAMNAYLGLAYNLYLIAHNEQIQKDLIKRLKCKDSFHGAYYEAHVAAVFIKAGFDLEFENERDSFAIHCEFTATCKKSGNKYSIEAKARAVEGILGKSRGASKKDPNIKWQLIKALNKAAKYPRIVFIDINVPNDVEENKGFIKALESLNTVETENHDIKGASAPQAYIFLTNFPYDYSKESTNFRCGFVSNGFKIPDFKYDMKGTLRELINARDKHKDIYQLIESMNDHYEIPATFDGEFPEFAFKGIGAPRLIIGRNYIIPDGTGKEVKAKLYDAVVMEQDKEIYGSYETDDGKHLLCRDKMTQEELNAYKRHPTTFFGTVDERNKQKINDPLELYDFFHNTYKRSSKEKLLEFMKYHPDIEELKKMSQSELASIYCERMVVSMEIKKVNS